MTFYHAPGTLGHCNKEVHGLLSSCNGVSLTVEFTQVNGRNVIPQ